MFRILALALAMLVLVAPLTAQPIAPPITPLEEAVAKIKPAVGVLYRETFVYDAQGKFLRTVWENAGTLTVIWSSEGTSCAATTAHGTAKKGEVVRTTYNEEQRINHKDPAFKADDPATWKVIRERTVRETHRFTGRYAATFDGQTLLPDGIELVASRGDQGLWDDFAVFRIPVGKLPIVEFGSEAMVRQASEIFMVHAPIGITQSFSKGNIARHIEDKMPTTGASYPFVRPVFVLDIRMAPGSSGSFVYVLVEKTGYAIGILAGYFYIGAAGGGQLGSDFPNALGIGRFKQFLAEEKIIEQCKSGQ